MGYWDTPPMDRNQILLFSPTLDAMIADDHPVRVLDEILSTMDWREWEGRYNGRIGRPPIPPKALASVILYGLSLGVRSSRQLERACTVSLDFMWLTSGRGIDHSTICEFRTAFSEELKGTFKQTGRIAMAMGLMRLNLIGLDGTRERANSSRHGTATAKTLEGRLAVLDQQIEAAFSEAEAADRRDEDLFGQTTPNKLPRELADLKRRQERLKKALEKARGKDAKRKGKAGAEGKKAGDVGEEPEGEVGKQRKGKAAKVPVADPDAAVMPNKDGGYAPNYTPVVTVDAERGYIVDADVDDSATEGHKTVQTVERIEEVFEQKVEQVMADGGYADGREMAELEEAGVQTYIPVGTAAGDAADNPAVRDDPTQAVPQEAWERLPRNKKGKKRPTLDRSAFVYDQSKGCFYCAMGRTLPLKDTQRRSRADGQVVTVYRYECVGCQGCELSEACRGGKGPRRIQVDEYEPVRQRVHARMNSPDGQAVYERRSWVCETPFAFIKSWMNFRQFLLRGLGKVNTEWRWTCTAYNLRKLVGDVQRLRRKFAALAA